MHSTSSVDAAVSGTSFEAFLPELTHEDAQTDTRGFRSAVDAVRAPSMGPRAVPSGGSSGTRAARRHRQCVSAARAAVAAVEAGCDTGGVGRLHRAHEQDARGA